jgi:ABC-type transport system involved in multi-copper enzyme maturation permease subunit
MVGGFFVYTLIDKLFFNTKKDGEDVMVVSFTPGVQRSQIFFSKALAYITTLAVFVLLGCVLPYGVLIGMATSLSSFP